MLRDIIEIDESLCDGCGECVPSCHEGALQIIDKKARLISDLMCDGLGACLGQCPTNAMQVIQREAVPYDERQVMINIIAGGSNVIKAHLDHMLDHNELEYYEIAVQVLNEQNIPVPETKQTKQSVICPGKKEQLINNTENNNISHDISSQLSHWPIQLHLINPVSLQFSDAELLLAADCSAFAAGNFHNRYLAGKKLAIACPKLDSEQEVYIEKLSMMIRYGKLKSLTILRMDVPCCGGLSQLSKKAMQHARRKIPLIEITINNQGIEI
ncbi:MAG: NAD-dependent dihydropyrimidine dehydrogenase PreA subunit [Oleiphilaceae bacterium]|jgi:NAD-dependent dihydropyrimidine dehydrogenase PreA subunit